MLLRTDRSVFRNSTGCAWLAMPTESLCQKQERLEQHTVTVSVASSSFWIAEQPENNRAEAVQVAGRTCTACTDARRGQIPNTYSRGFSLRSSQTSVSCACSSNKLISVADTNHVSCILRAVTSPCLGDIGDLVH